MSCCRHFIKFTRYARIRENDYAWISTMNSMAVFTKTSFSAAPNHDVYVNVAKRVCYNPIQVSQPA
jgi:hypothetical protein